MDSCNSAGGYIHGLHLAKKKKKIKCIPCRTYTRCGRALQLSLSLSLFGILNRRISLHYPLPIIPPLGVSHIIRHPRKSGAHPVHRMHPGRQQWAGFCAIMLLGDRITDRYDLARFQRGSEILSRTRMNGPIFFLFGDRARKPSRNYWILATPQLRKV